MFNNSSNIDASHSTFSEVNRDQYYTSRSVIQGNQTIHTIVHGNQIIQDSRSNLSLETLQKASALSAAYDSAQRYPAPKCLEGTRVELLDCLVSWMEDSDQKPICWLNGRPGSGKSAVSQTIAEKYASQNHLAASFFFSRRDLERRTTRHVIPTLTTQLLSFLPSIRPAVVAALEADYMIPMKVLREQMEKLLIGPLTMATETPESPILIIVDALDECDDESLVSELVALLALLVRKVSLPMRLLITSRTEPWIQAQFHHPDTSPLTLSLEIHAFNAEDDIRAFLRHTLDYTYDQHLSIMQHLPRPWPAPDDLEQIVAKASGLFIFAMTVVKFVSDRIHNPAERLQAILEDKPSTSLGLGSAYADLDALYRDAISVFPNPDVARLVLGVVYCSIVPLTVSGLYKLLQRPDVDVRLVVPALGSVLLSSEDEQQPTQFYHASFRDFLVNPQRSKEYTIDPDIYHQLMAQFCFETMSRSLKRDMCGIGDPSLANSEVPDLTSRRAAAIDEALRYACRFWSRHLASLAGDGIAHETLLSALERFSTTVLLHWIEVLSLFGEAENAVVMLRDGIRWLKTLRNAPGNILALLQDAERLAVLNMEPISQCALHVYQTALCAAPTSSVISTTFKHQSFVTLVVYPPRSDSWTSTRRAIKLHNPVYSVVFSPTNDLVAAAVEKQGVQLWNIITGSNVASLGDPSSTSLVVCFSPSGAFLAAAFEGGNVTIWDPRVGREHMNDQGCHTEAITCLEFSKDSNLLASGSRDNLILVWSVKAAQRLYRLAAHEGPVTSLAFADNSLRLCSGSEERLVIIWDMSSGKLVRGMMGHRKSVNCVAISKDGNTIASGSEDKSIKIWNVTSGKCTHTFSKPHCSGIRSLHFFNEDKQVVAACDEVIVSWTIASRNTFTMLWSVEGLTRSGMVHVPAWQAKVIGWGAPKPLLKFIDKAYGGGGTDADRPVLAYATNSPSFAFGFRDFTFTGILPNLVAEFPLSASASVTHVAISADGSWVVTADHLGSLQFLDLSVSRRTWEEVETILNGNPLCTAEKLVPSPSGKRFIIKNVLHWYLADDEYHVVKKLDFGMLGPLRGQDRVQFKFSADSSIFISVVHNFLNDEKSTVRVFDTLTGDQRAQFTGLKEVQTFLASPDGNWVACAYVGEGVVILGVATGMKKSIAVSAVTALDFSDGGDELVTGSKAGVVQIWDRASGLCNSTFQGSASTVTALASATSSSGTQIAIGREDGSISIWFPSTGVSLEIARGDHAMSKNVDFIKFSDDETTITSRGEDLAVSKWAIPANTDPTLDVQLVTSETVGEGGGSDARPLPSLISRTDPDDVCDCRFHTSYMVRKDGWIVEGSRRILWLPATTRPHGKDTFYAYDNGLLVFFTSIGTLLFMRCINATS